MRRFETILVGSATASLACTAPTSLLSIVDTMTAQSPRWLTTFGRSSHRSDKGFASWQLFSRFLEERNAVRVGVCAIFGSFR